MDDLAEHKFPLWFPESEAEADARHVAYVDVENDPLPDVKPSLLGARDIFDYAVVTGLIAPFETNRDKLHDKLKTASYEVDFLGEVHEVDEQGKLVRPTKIRHGTRYCLRRNSIAFVYLQTRFRLPRYIAVRFNLRITHVHRGLLLGTGPLVDPGFNGRLLVPLHNLTSEDYVLVGGEGFIWVEFTKLSSAALHPSGRPPKISSTQFSAVDYFRRASGGVPVRSSIPDIILQASSAASEAKAQVRWFTIGGFVGLVALLAAMFSLVNDTLTFVSQTANENANLKTKVESHLSQTGSDFASLRSELEALKTETAALRQTLGSRQQPSTIEARLTSIESALRDIETRAKKGERLPQQPR
jgi:deoxycytidine triphosphate deaminase